MSARNYSSTAAQTTLASGVDASATTLSVSATTGFPSVPFTIAVDAGASAQEVVLVTNVAGTNLTVTRGYDSTVAVSHDTGAVVQHSHVAMDFREANQHVNATTGVHGVSGALVGTTDTQTLTNKSLTSPAIASPTVTGSLTGIGGAMSAWTPAVTSEGGSFGTASGAGRFIQIGKLVFYTVDLNTGSAGTATGGARFTLPVAARGATGSVGSGTHSVNGINLQAHLVSATVASIHYYDATTAITPGVVLRVSGFYEAA